MIGFLRGSVILRDGNYIILDVSGVGYKVLAASDVLAKAIKGTSLELFIYTHVREDNISLFGFLESSELKLFERLIGVSGIGPKTAMNIFSIGTKDSITSAIAKGDVSFFTQVPRLGRKNAQKIIIELKGKLDLDSVLQNGEEHSEVAAALKNFGFTASEIHQALREINSQGKNTQEKVKLALKYLGK